MKRTLVIMLVVLFSLTLIGCEKSNSNTNLDPSQQNLTNEKTTEKTVSVYRFSNPVIKLHSYVLGEDNKTKFSAEHPSDWRFDGLAFNTYTKSKKGTLPVYQFNNTQSKNEYFTISKDEKTLLDKNPDWQYSGIAWYAELESNDNNAPIYQMANSSYKFFTLYASEKEALEKTSGWTFEKIAFYVAK